MTCKKYKIDYVIHDVMLDVNEAEKTTIVDNLWIISRAIYQHTDREFYEKIERLKIFRDAQIHCS